MQGCRGLAAEKEDCAVQPLTKKWKIAHFVKQLGSRKMDLFFFFCINVGVSYKADTEVKKPQQEDLSLTVELCGLTNLPVTTSCLSSGARLVAVFQQPGKVVL